MRRNISGEWAYEGTEERRNQVIRDGSFTRYQGSVHVGVRNERASAK